MSSLRNLPFPLIALLGVLVIGPLLWVLATGTHITNLATVFAQQQETVESPVLSVEVVDENNTGNPILRFTWTTTNANLVDNNTFYTRPQGSGGDFTLSSHLLTVEQPYDMLDSFLWAVINEPIEIALGFTLQGDTSGTVYHSTTVVLQPPGSHIDLSARGREDSTSGELTLQFSWTSARSYAASTGVLYSRPVGSTSTDAYTEHGSLTGTNSDEISDSTFWSGYSEPLEVALGFSLTTFSDPRAAIHYSNPVKLYPPDYLAPTLSLSKRASQEGKEHLRLEWAPNVVGELGATIHIPGVRRMLTDDDFVTIAFPTNGGTYLEISTEAFNTAARGLELGSVLFPREITVGFSMADDPIGRTYFPTPVEYWPTLTPQPLTVERVAATTTATTTVPATLRFSWTSTYGLYSTEFPLASSLKLLSRPAGSSVSFTKHSDVALWSPFDVSESSFWYGHTTDREVVLGYIIAGDPTRTTYFTESVTLAAPDFNVTVEQEDPDSVRFTWLRPSLYATSTTGGTVLQTTIYSRPLGSDEDYSELITSVDRDTSGTSLVVTEQTLLRGLDEPLQIALGIVGEKDPAGAGPRYSNPFGLYPDDYMSPTLSLSKFTNDQGGRQLRFSWTPQISTNPENVRLVPYARLLRSQDDYLKLLTTSYRQVRTSGEYDTGEGNFKSATLGLGSTLLPKEMRFGFMLADDPLNRTYFSTPIEYWPTLNSQTLTVERVPATTTASTTEEARLRFSWTSSYGPYSFEYPLVSSGALFSRPAGQDGEFTEHISVTGELPYELTESSFWHGHTGELEVVLGYTLTGDLTGTVNFTESVNVTRPSGLIDQTATTTPEAATSTPEVATTTPEVATTTPEDSAPELALERSFSTSTNEVMLRLSWTTDRSDLITYGFLYARTEGTTDELREMSIGARTGDTIEVSESTFWDTARSRWPAMPALEVRLRFYVGDSTGDVVYTDPVVARPPSPPVLSVFRTAKPNETDASVTFDWTTDRTELRPNYRLYDRSPGSSGGYDDRLSTGGSDSEFTVPETFLWSQQENGDFSRSEPVEFVVGFRVNGVGDVVYSAPVTLYPPATVVSLAPSNLAYSQHFGFEDAYLDLTWEAPAPRSQTDYANFPEHSSILGYQILRRAAGSDSEFEVFVEDTASLDTSYRVESGQHADRHEYAVKATNYSGRSAAIEGGAVRFPRWPTPLVAPSISSVELVPGFVGESRVEIEWDPPVITRDVFSAESRETGWYDFPSDSGITGYRIDRVPHPSTETPAIVAEDTAGTSTTLTDGFSGQQDTTFHYRVAGINPSGVGTFSQPVAVDWYYWPAPLAPSGVAVQSEGPVVAVSWTAPEPRSRDDYEDYPSDSGITGYQVFRRVADSGADYELFADNAGDTSTSYRFTPVGENGISYEYFVRAINPSGTSEDSAPVTFQQELDAPAPVDLQPVAMLVWSAPDDSSITGYQILRRRNGSGDDYDILVENTNSTSTMYADTNRGGRCHLRLRPEVHKLQRHQCSVKTDYPHGGRRPGPGPAARPPGLCFQRRRGTKLGCSRRRYGDGLPDTPSRTRAD